MLGIAFKLKVPLNTTGYFLPPFLFALKRNRLFYGVFTSLMFRIAINAYRNMDPFSKTFCTLILHPHKFLLHSCNSIREAGKVKRSYKLENRLLKSLVC